MYHYCWLSDSATQLHLTTNCAYGVLRTFQDFFDQFEQQTGGENFNRENVYAAQLHNSDVNNATDALLKEKEHDDDDDMNDFFDEFEKTTGGENFRRHS